MTPEEIQKLVKSLTQSIIDLESKQNELRKLIVSVQKMCTHPRWEKYGFKDMEFGFCPDCRFEKDKI